MSSRGESVYAKLLPPDLTWDKVLRSGQPLAPWYGDLQTYLKTVVIPSGYKWFEWNGLIYGVQYEPPGPKETEKRRTYFCTEVPTDILDYRSPKQRTAWEKVVHFSNRRIAPHRRNIGMAIFFFAMLYLGGGLTFFTGIDPNVPAFWYLWGGCAVGLGLAFFLVQT